MTFWSKEALRKSRKWRSYLLVVVGAYVLTLGLATVITPLRLNLENLVFDQYQRWKPRPYDFSQPVRIVDIDDELIHLIGRWPWSRRTMADLVEALVKANVAVIGFDYLFSEKDQADRRCREVRCRAAAIAPTRRRVARSAPMATPRLLKPFGPSRRPRRVSHADPQRLPGEPHDQGRILLRRRSADALVTSLQRRARADPRTRRRRGGSRLLELAAGQRPGGPPRAPAARGQWPDPAEPRARDAAGRPGGDGLHREIDDRLRQHRRQEPTSSTRSRTETSIVPVQADGQLRVWFAKSDPRRSIPAWKVLQPDADLSDLAGKIVLVGASASLLSDIVATPLDPSTPGRRGACPAHRADPFRRDACSGPTGRRARSCWPARRCR